ncbi:IS110 family transposase, partial [Vibrio ruber]|uniref:IS110 family transposase n=1 Tax=Vibrio ruber TaxID=184755 RepID=UPI0013564385
MAKNVFQICALDDKRLVLLNKKVRRNDLLDQLRQFEPTLVVTEACYTANLWGRRIQQLGHTVKFVPTHAVKPFLIGNKNDANDALAIAEAALRPKIHFVSVKTVEQQDLQSLYKIRELLVRQRTAQVNQLRGLLAEYGEVLPKGLRHVREEIPEILENAENELSHIARDFFHHLYQSIQDLSIQIDVFEQKILQLVQGKDDYHRLLTIPGVGQRVAAAVLAFVSDIHAFKNGRQFAVWLGLTPKQISSGESNRIGRMTKRGNPTLRYLLILG